MAIYDNLPYTNFHELNADWLLKQMKEAKAKIDDYQEVLDQFEEDYQALLALANAMTVAGSNVTVAGTLTAARLIGNLTGNVTGNLNGNAATADSATSASTADYATTAGSVTSTEASEITVSAETDANNCIPAEYRAQFYQIAGDASNLPSGINTDYPCLLLTSYLKEGSTSLLVQFCWPSASERFFMRIRYSGLWQTWKRFTLS